MGFCALPKIEISDHFALLSYFFQTTVHHWVAPRRVEWRHSIAERAGAHIGEKTAIRVRLPLHGALRGWNVFCVALLYYIP